VAANVQTMPQLLNDQPAYAAASDAFQSLSREKWGDVGVANSKANSSLRQANNAPTGGGGDSDVARMAFMRRYGIPLSASPASPSPAVSDRIAAAERVTQYTQQQRFVNGRNFFQNGSQWVDSEVQRQQNAKTVRIQFASQEYFDLFKNQPQARPWLALGQNLQFVLNGTVYEIFDKNG
jgi:hypothetical protein